VSDARLPLPRIRRGLGETLSRLPYALRPARIRNRPSWAIGIYQGAGPFDLQPMAGVRQPVLTRRDVRDVDAAFVADPFLLTWEDRWYLFFEVLDWATGLGRDRGRVECRWPGVTILDLHGASHPLGPYRPHPASPIVTGDGRLARPGGRIVRHGGRLYRLAQDCSRTYGERVWAVEIVHLDDERYQELPMLHKPVVCGSGRGWNRGRMHHVVAHPQADGSWLAAVDGW